jgi:hypothetical protein
MDTVQFASARLLPMSHVLISATLLITSMSVIVANVAVATALPKTSCAHVTAAWSDRQSMRHQAKVAAFARPKH